MRRASWNPELAGNVAGRWWRGVWRWGGEWWYGWGYFLLKGGLGGWKFFSRQMRRRMRRIRTIPLTLFYRIWGGLMMLRADHVDTMFKVAPGSCANQDQKRLVRFCHSIKYRNRDEWDFLEKCNLTRQKVCIIHISLTVKLWKGLLTTSSQFFVSCLICNQGAKDSFAENICFRPKMDLAPTTINICSI